MITTNEKKNRLYKSRNKTTKIENYKIIKKVKFKRIVIKKDLERKNIYKR